MFSSAKNAQYKNPDHQTDEMCSLSGTKALTKKSLQALKIGTGEEELQNGKDFYKYFFSNYPDLRVYFKGAEDYGPEEVQQSERFEKQGQRLLVALHVLVNVFDDPMVFKAYTRDVVTRHRQFKLDPELYKAFWTVWLGFLETKTSLDEATKQAWQELGRQFAQEAIEHMEKNEFPR